jgi:hypothetical protein
MPGFLPRQLLLEHSLGVFSITSCVKHAAKFSTSNGAVWVQQSFYRAQNMAVMREPTLTTTLEQHYYDLNVSGSFRTCE